MDPVNNNNTIITKRRRPNKIIIYTKIAHKLFKNLSEKDLPYLIFTYFYNIEINIINKKD